ISLAYDGYQPTVTYTSSGLNFAHRIGPGAWTSELVDGNGGGSISLAYDDSGNPSISYTGAGSEKHPWKGSYLKFAHWNGSSWDIQTVDEAPGSKSLAYDLNGNPAIAYQHSNGSRNDPDLRFAHWNGASSSWDIEIIETGEGFGAFACLAFDPTTGYPSIIHTAAPVRLASWNGSSWETEEIVGSGMLPSFAYNSAGTAFVSYGISDVLEVAQLAPGRNWETETVDWVRLFASRTSIAIDPDGNPGVSYQDYAPYDGDLKFASLGSFNARPTVTITSPADGSTFPSGDTVPIVFAGTADDREDGDLTASLTWVSDIDGPIGSGGSFSTTLSTGRHVITASVTDSGGRTGSDSVSIIVGQPTTPTLYVEDIAMDWGKAGINYYALATVWIIDDAITDVEGATVYGRWSGDVSGTASGVTGADGKVTLQSPKKKNGGTFTFTVTGVAASGYIYDEGLNAETKDSITAP
ncbi:MAG: hypothetical protein JSW59_15235, partial [Phycisphaerales bacterium]